MAFLASSYRSVASLHTNGQRSGRQLSVRSYAQGAKQFVEDNIKNNKVVVFSKSYCPYCTKAKSSLATLLPKDKFAVFEIENRTDVDEVQDVLLGITGGRSVPRVFVGGKFIGGGDDTARLAQSGELKTMLAAVGVL